MRVFGYKSEDITLKDCKFIGGVLGSVLALAIINNSTSAGRKDIKKKTNFHSASKKEAEREAKAWRNGDNDD